MNVIISRGTLNLDDNKSTKFSWDTSFATSGLSFKNPSAAMNEGQSLQSSEQMINSRFR